MTPQRKDPVALLLERFPELADRLDEYDLDSPYMAFGSFAQYILEHGPHSPIAARAVEFMNELAETDLELQNLVQVSVFEIWVGDSEFAAIVREQLRQSALRLFIAADHATDLPD